MRLQSRFKRHWTFSLFASFAIDLFAAGIVATALGDPDDFWVNFGLIFLAISFLPLVLAFYALIKKMLYFWVAGRSFMADNIYEHMRRGNLPVTNGYYGDGLEYLASVRDNEEEPVGSRIAAAELLGELTGISEAGAFASIASRTALDDAVTAYSRR